MRFGFSSALTSFGFFKSTGNTHAALPISVDANRSTIPDSHSSGTRRSPAGGHYGMLRPVRRFQKLMQAVNPVPSAIRLSLQIEASNPQSCRPPFGFGFQSGSRGVINGAIDHSAQKGRCFVGCESQIARNPAGWQAAGEDLSVSTAPNAWS
jgi:hypothetical protein